MRRRVVLLTAVWMSFSLLGQAADKDGWVSLFDGKTLDGWTQKSLHE